MFHFSLESLLRLRKSLEHIEELRLLDANHRVERQRALIIAAEEWGRALNERRAVELKLGANGAELQFEIACRDQLQVLMQTLQKQLAALVEQRARQQEHYSQARRDREILEQLRDEQFARYHLEEVRRQQRRADETFLLRRRYQQG